VKQIMEEDNIKKMYDGTKQIAIMEKKTNLFSGNEGEEYLRHGSKEADKKAKAQLSKINDRAREMFNQDNSINPCKTFLREVKNCYDHPQNEKGELFADRLASILRSNDPKEKIAELNKKENADIKTRLTATFHGLFDLENTQALLKYAGVKNIYDIIKIGGQTPDEKYGEKYANVEKPEDRELLIQAEIINHIVYNGKEPVSIDTYAINKDNKVVPGEPYVVKYDELTVEKQCAFFSELDALHDDLKGQLDTLISTQKNKNANLYGDRGSVEGSKYYQAMIKKLKECVDHTDLDKNGGRLSFDELKQNLKELAAVSATYYQKRDNLFSAKLDNGKLRKGVSAFLKDEMPYRIEKLTDLSDGVRPKFSPLLGKDAKENLNNILDQNVYQRKFADIDASKDYLHDPGAAFMKHRIEATRKDNLRKTLMSTVSKFDRERVRPEGKHIEYMDNMFEKSDTDKLIDCAKEAVKRKYLRRIWEADQVEGRILYHTEKTIESAEFQKRFTLDVKNLVNSNDFRAIYKKEGANPVKVANSWNKIAEIREKDTFNKSSENVKDVCQKNAKYLKNPSQGGELNVVVAAAATYVSSLIEQNKLDHSQNPNSICSAYTRSKEFKNVVRSAMNNKSIDLESYFKNVNLVQKNLNEEKERQLANQNSLNRSSRNVQRGSQMHQMGG
ncbi:MAG: hypothetical protein J5842_04195, partial [Lachnospiraceae bacterium]|nr:hypothetical protein [Lachnospiraceae bacterium]